MLVDGINFNENVQERLFLLRVTNTMFKLAIYQQKK